MRLSAWPGRMGNSGRVECLDLSLLVDTHANALSAGRGETHNVTNLLDKARVRRQLEGLGIDRLEITP